MLERDRSEKERGTRLCSPHPSPSPQKWVDPGAKPKLGRGVPTVLWRPLYSKPYGKELFFSTPPARRFPVQTLGAVRGPERRSVRRRQDLGLSLSCRSACLGSADRGHFGLQSGPAAQPSSAGASNRSASPGEGSTRRLHPGEGRGGSREEEPPPPGKVPLSGHEGVSSLLSPPDCAARGPSTR